MLDVRLVSGLLVDNIRRTGLPVPAPRDVITRWARGLDIPREGDLFFFTGGLYQLMPYIAALVAILERLEPSGKAGSLALRAAGVLGRVPGLTGAALRPDPGYVSYSEEVVRSIYRLLAGSGIRVAYDPQADAYSGSILYDLGLEREFRDHARRVYERLVERGIDRVVTIDPHTTHMLKNVYPEYLEGYRLEVHSYLELLKIEAPSSIGGDVVIHDPCLYARHLSIVEAPRNLLRVKGYRVVEPRRSGRMTYCCGGPIEGIYPSLAKKVARVRVEELASAGKRVCVMCPICYSNLKAVAPEDLEIVDIASLLATARQG